MQLMRAYSAFNNHGKMVYPKLIKSFIEGQGVAKLVPYKEQVRAIQSATAARVQKILIKTVNEGTGKKAITQGLVIGGKTGTANVVKKGKYVQRYNASFIGFANDKKRKLSIGVVVVEPKHGHFASQTAVPVFKKAVDILIEDGYLKPNIVK